MPAVGQAFSYYRGVTLEQTVPALGGRDEWPFTTRWQVGCTMADNGWLYPSDSEFPDGSMWEISATLHIRGLGGTSLGYVFPRIYSRDETPHEDAPLGWIDEPQMTQRPLRVTDGEVQAAWALSTFVTARPGASFRFDVFADNVDEDDYEADLAVVAHSVAAVEAMYPYQTS